jgi:hypothetical protein
MGPIPSGVERGEGGYGDCGDEGHRKGGESHCGGPVDSRPVILGTTDNQISIGGQQGHPPDTTQTTNPNTDGRVHPGMQARGADWFKGYLGNVQYPVDSAPLWIYTGRDR